MFQEQSKQTILLFLGLIGIIVSGLAGLSEYVPALQSFCASFSNGCKDTATVTLLHLPVWAWGVVFYAVLTLCLWRLRKAVVWFVSAGTGVEVVLVWTMWTMKAFCVFCIANFLVILLILLISFEKRNFWQTLAIASLCWVVAFFNIPSENRATPLPTEGAGDQPRIVAQIGRESVTSERLDRMVGSKLLDLQKEIYKLRKDRLDQLVMDQLVTEEAASRNMTLEDLVNKVIVPVPPKVEEAEIDGYIRENRDHLKDWTGAPDDLKNRIRTYFEQQKRYNAIVQYAKTLEPKYGVTIYLKEPQPILARIDVEGSPSIGPADAAVTIVEYSDFQCPACRATHEVVQKLRSTFGNRVRWVFKDYPLKKHKYAQSAAEAARCAGLQGKYWDYQNVLYASQEEFTPDKLVQFAQGLGLSTGEFKQCLESGRFKASVEQGQKEAISLGVDRTPSFFINGKLVVGGPSFDSFKRMIEEELNKPKREP